MMKLTFYGGVQDVTGSCHLVTLDSGFTILLDCGLYQGNRPDMENFNQEWLFDPKTIDCLILSHAHIDHCGRIPKLVKDGFRGNIYCTHATRDLAHILLLDSAFIQEKDAEFFHKKKSGNAGYQDRDFQEPLYQSKDVLPALELFITVGYDRWFTINEELSFQFSDAGHILGSAGLTLRITENNEVKLLGFTGDIGRPERPILRDPKPLPPVDFLISESTYGNKEHDASPKEMEKFLQILTETCIEKGGKVIIPAFSVGRTQELVYMLDQLENEGRLPLVPVFVDSPLAVNATMVYAAHPECFDEDISEYLLMDDNPFGFKRLKYIRKQSDSMALNTLKGPAIIISASGMINAGRIKHHVAHAIENPNNTILIVGYCSPHTPGGKLRAGNNFIYLLGHKMEVKANIEILDSFSAHGDRLEMLEYLKNQKGHVKKLFLVHGEQEAKKAFSTLLSAYGFPEAIIPTVGESFEM
jgi:metallo-beta-lactamase family protein